MLPAVDEIHSGVSNNIRHHALEKIALLSGPTQPASSGNDDLEQLSRLASLRAVYINGTVGELHKNSRPHKISLKTSQLEVLLVLATAAPLVKDAKRAGSLLKQLSLYLSEAYAQSIETPVFPKRFEPSPLEALTFSLSSAILSIGFNHPSLKAQATSALQSYVEEWSKAAFSLSPSQIDGGELDEYVHEVEIVEVMMLVVSLQGYLSAVTEKVHFWNALDRLKLVQLINSALSSQFMITVEVALSIVRNSQKRHGRLRDWKRISKHYSAVLRPLGASLLQYSFMELVSRSASILIVPMDDVNNTKILKKLMNAARIPKPTETENLPLEELVTITLDEMKLLDNDSDFLQLRAPWQQRLSFRIKAKTLLTFLCCSILDQDLAEPELLMSWLEETLWDPVQMADEVLAETVLRCMAILSKLSASMATDLSRLLPRFIVRGGLTPQVASVVAQSLANVLKMLPSDAVITTLYSLGNVLSASASNPEIGSVAFHIDDETSKSNALGESYNQRTTGSTISLLINNEDEKSIVHSNLVKTIVQIATIYNDENVIDLARSMLIQKGGTVNQTTDLQIIEQAAKLGIQGSSNDLRALLNVYSKLCRDAISQKNFSVVEAVKKARLYISSNIPKGSVAFETYIRHLFDDITCIGEVQRDEEEHQASFDLAAKELEQFLQPLARVIEKHSEAFEELCLTDDLFKLQRDSWFNIIVHGFDLTSKFGKDNLKYLRIFAKHSNSLVAENWAGELESDVELNTVLRRGMYTSLLISHKQRLAEAFPAKEYEIRNLTYPEAVFLNTAYVLETLRAECGNCTRSLNYFLDPKLRKSAMGNCMVAIAIGAMTKYINRAAAGTSHLYSAPFVAEQLAISLIKSCHRVSKVQEVASMCATQMIENIPSSLCQRRSLFVMLELLDMMWISCLEEEADEFSWRSKFQSKREMIRIDLSDDYNFRKTTLNNFLNNAKSWIAKAINIAPLDIKGLLQTYLSECDEEAIFGHVSLGRSFAIAMGSTIPTTDHRLTAIEQNDLNINAASDFLAQYTDRQEYRLMRGVFNNSCSRAGEVGNGDLSLSKTFKRPQEPEHVENLLYKLKKSLVLDKLVAIDQLRDVLKKAATLLCTNTPNQNTIIHLLVSIPFIAFTKSSIKLGIALWTGIIKENPLVETRIMTEIAAQWENTIHKRVGVFQGSFSYSDPFFQKQEFAPSDKNYMFTQQNKAQNLVSPHFRILQFFSSRFRASRLDNNQIQRVYYRLIRTTLDAMPFATSHPLARHIHFYIILFGFHILRFTTILNYHEKWRLKDLILSSALCWFASTPKWSYGGNRLHGKSEVHLLADIESSIYNTESIGLRSIGTTASLKAKQDLLILLLSSEQARLMVWLNPSAHEKRKYFSLGQSKLSQEASLLVLAETAWMENPSLALQLVFRFPSLSIRQKIRSLLLQYPHKTLGELSSVELLLGSSIPSDVSYQLKYLLFWAPVNPITAITYFLPAYGNHPLILQYAMRALKSHSVDITFFYVPQIVQMLRYDFLEYIERYIIEAAKFSQLFAHQIIWNMKANAFKDEDAEIPDPVKPVLDKVMDRLISSFSELDRQFYEKEFGFFNEVTGVSGKLRPYIKRPKPEKKQKIEEELRNIKVEVGVYLPSNPDGIVVGIDRKSGTPLQSHAKAPYKATFRIRKRKDPETLKDANNSKTQMARSRTNDFTYEVWQSAIFKVGDDCRQDVLALQMIAAFRGIFHSVGLDGYVYPYRVTATAPGCGVIDVLPNSVSRDMLGREAVNGLYDYFISKFGSEDSIVFQEARTNFVKSMAAYSVICYLLQLKDRHNGNIMIDDAGHILHIDFGFCFDIAPGGVRFERAPFKLTTEMVAVMGGSIDSQPFRWFEELCIKAFLASRPHATHLSHMVLAMLDSGLPCFKPETISHFMDRFVLERNEKDAASFMKDLVRKSYNSYSTRGYDQFQLLTNGIPY